MRGVWTQYQDLGPREQGHGRRAEARVGVSKREGGAADVFVAGVEHGRTDPVCWIL